MISVARLRPEQIGASLPPYAILLLVGATVTAVALVRTVKQRATLTIGFSLFFAPVGVGLARS